MNGYFPYPYRPCQEAMVAFIRNAAILGRNAVLESGTGTGKTAVSLAGALSAAAGTGRKVVYLTRTKSQHRQVAIECRAISANIPVVSAAVQGRGTSTCPLMREDRDLQDGSPEELSKLCSELKKGDGSAGGCPYYQAITAESVESCISFIRSSGPDPEEFRDYCQALGVCPYEAVKKVLPYADVVSASYAFMFDPRIRSRFLGWMGVSEKDIIIIVDGSHNLPSYLRESETAKFTRHALDLALSEARRSGDPDVGHGLHASDVINAVGDILEEAQKEYLRRENDLIPPGYMEETLMTVLGMNSLGLKEVLAGLYDAGSRIAEERKSRRKLPRSHLYTLARFLLYWMECTDGSHVFLVSGGDNPALEAYCLDPSDAATPLRICRSSISMSGTLAPLQDYCKDMGLWEADTEEFPSPFNPDNRRTLYVADVSTKYAELNSDDGTYERLRRYIIDIVNSVKVSTAVFFPSYAVMQRFLEDGLAEALGRIVFVEEPGIGNTELMDRVMAFRCTAGSVLICVCGGRISEGLDFPGKEMELAVLVGIPFGRPSARQDALISYCQARFADGWGMAVRAPAVRKMRQSIGRLIRSENDRGIAVILDRRACTLDGLEAELTTDPVSEVKAFFGVQE